MILSYLIGKNVDKAMSVRKDGSPQLRFFHGYEYGAKMEPFSFLSGKNRLYGHIYSYGKGPYKAIVVFFHGFGAGHESYTQEICAVAKAGYLVYSYDCTGCVSSEGSGVISLTQSLFDQKAFFAYLKDDPKAQGLDIYTMGHSWGGFTALISCLPQYHVKKCVSIAGFMNVVAACETSGPAILKKHHKALVASQKREFGEMGIIDAVDVANSSSAKILYIQGDQDKVCPFEECYGRLEREGKNPNLTLYKVPGLGHQPYWTKSAQQYYWELGKKQRIFDVNRDLDYEVDYKRLNEDDPKVLQAIIDFLDA